MLVSGEHPILTDKKEKYFLLHSYIKPTLLIAGHRPLKIPETHEKHQSTTPANPNNKSFTFSDPYPDDPQKNNTNQ